MINKKVLLSNDLYERFIKYNSNRLKQVGSVHKYCIN